jgi:Smg protein
MKESILDVLLYLFEHFVADAPLEDADGGRSARRFGRDFFGPETGEDPDALHQNLLEAGFSTAEIRKAFDWLEGLDARRPGPAAPRAAGAPVRIYAGPELDKIEVEARGFLMFLEQQGILDADQRELVVDRAMALDQDTVEPDDLKWVVLMVLFNHPGSEAAYAWMETQLFEDEDERLH